MSDVTDMFASAQAAFAPEAARDPDWVRALRQEALGRFQGQGLPTRKHEEWKYTSLRELGELSYGLSDGPTEVAAAALAAHVDPQDVTLVFLDGVLSTAHSRLGDLPAGLTVMPLEEAFVKRADVVKRLVEHSEHAFGQLNAAFVRSGILVDVAKGAVLNRKIHLLHVATPGQEQAVAYFPRHLLALGESAEAVVVETFLGLPPAAAGVGKYLVTAATDIELAANAKLRHARLQLETPRGFHVSRVRATLARDAEFLTLSVSAGARLARCDLDIALTGSGARVELDGLYLVKSGQHTDNHTSVDHLVPDATSSQLYKGVLDGDGRAVFNGKVFVRRDAQRTNAFQLNRNLLLSTEAEIDTKPELQIDADDVKCSHGAAVGQLSSDQLFYLESRGLRPDAAIRMLSQAFVDEVLLKETVPGLAGKLRPLTMGYFAK